MIEKEKIIRFIDCGFVELRTRMLFLYIGTIIVISAVTMLFSKNKLLMSLFMLIVVIVPIIYFLVKIKERGEKKYWFLLISWSCCAFSLLFLIDAYLIFKYESGIESAMLTMLIPLILIFVSIVVLCVIIRLTIKKDKYKNRNAPASPAYLSGLIGGVLANIVARRVFANLDTTQLGLLPAAYILIFLSFIFTSGTCLNVMKVYYMKKLDYKWKE